MRSRFVVPERSKVCFAKLGFSFNPNFTDETAACMLVGEQASVMLLRHKKSRSSRSCRWPILPRTLALYCFSVSSREEVDTVARAALAAGGVEADGFAVGALLSGLIADVWGIRPAIWAVAALTAASGILVAIRMYETTRLRQHPSIHPPPVG